MKIGLVTVADSANYGSFLQGLALKKVLEEMGHEVRFLPTREKKYIRGLYYRWKPGRSDFRHPFRFIKKNKNGRKKFLKFKEEQEQMGICPSSDLRGVDLFLLGSDEIWNICTEVFRQPVFYGYGKRNVAAYAVSVGKASCDDFRNYPEIVNKICELRDICVRDQKTWEIVEELTGKKTPLVCDPTFLVDKCTFVGDYTDDYLKNHQYILIYIYPNLVAGKDVKVIREFAEKLKLKLVSIGFYNEWCDYNAICGPMEFCAVIRRAEYVVTATFHGSIFSILNEKQFISIALSEKVEDLLERLGLETRLIKSETMTQNWLEEALIEKKINYREVNEKIEKWKQNSIKELKEVVEKYASGNM